LDVGIGFITVPLHKIAFKDWTEQKHFRSSSSYDGVTLFSNTSILR